MSKIDEGVRTPGDRYGGFDEDLTSPYTPSNSDGVHNIEDPQFVPAYQPRAQVKEHDPDPPLGPVRWFIGALGRSLITAGLLILLFVAYQLWGTSLYTERQQRALGNEFEEQLAAVDADTASPEPGAAIDATDPTLEPLATAIPTAEPLLLGQGVARIEIPKINADYTVVEGTGREDLKNGPGHYPGTPLPGETGNAAIAGHRTTYGAPFYRLDELQEGDEITTQTLQGSFTYVVTSKEIVSPDAVEVLDPKGDNRLTLTTCHPKYSAAKRLIVTAELRQGASDAKVATYVERELPEGYDEGAAGDLAADGDSEIYGFHAPTGETYAWGALLLFVGIGWWYEFRRKHSLATWMAGFVPFIVVLFFFYGGVEQMLPAGF